MELQQTAGDPASQQFRCAAHTPFPHHIPPMMFDRAWTNSIDRRNLFIGKTAPNTLKDFAFPNGQCSGPLPTFPHHSPIGAWVEIFLLRMKNLSTIRKKPEGILSLR